MQIEQLSMLYCIEEEDALLRGKQMWRQKQFKVQKTKKLIFWKPWCDSIPLQFNRKFCNNHDPCLSRVEDLPHG